MTLSSAEAKYVASTTTTCQVVWMLIVLMNLKHDKKESTIALSNNHVFHKRSKHIDMRYHLIREMVNNGEINLKYCRSEKQLTYIFTKALAQEQFEYLRKKLRIV